MSSLRNTIQSTRNVDCLRCFILLVVVVVLILVLKVLALFSLSPSFLCLCLSSCSFFYLFLTFTLICSLCPAYRLCVHPVPLCHELLAQHLELCCQTRITKAECAKCFRRSLSRTVPSCQEDVRSKRRVS